MNRKQVPELTNKIKNKATEKRNQRARIPFELASSELYNFKDESGSEGEP